jgi:hypothetical protein
MFAPARNRDAMIYLHVERDRQPAVFAQGMLGKELPEESQIVVDELAILGRSGLMIVQQPTRAGKQCLGLG